MATGALRAGHPYPYNTSVLLSLRDFHKADFEILWHIDQQCFAPGISYSRPELAAYIRMVGAFTLVAEAAAQAVRVPPNRAGERQPESVIVGFVVASINLHCAGHIITIDVIPDARRSGVGSSLLNAAERRLQSVGGTQVRLETAVNNSAALAFYKRHGYSVAKTIPRYYPDGLDAFVMQKDLLSEPLGR